MIRETALSRWLLATALGATAVAASWFGGGQDNGRSAPGAAGRTRHEPAPPTVRLAGPATPAADLAGAPTLELHQRAMAHASADMFENRSWEPPPAERTPDPPQLQVQAPAASFAYVGRMIEYGEVTVFLEAEDRIHAVKAAQTVDGDYRIDEIRDDTVLLTYLPLGTRQTLQLRERADSARSADAESAPAPAMGRRTRRAQVDLAPVAGQPDPETDPGGTRAAH